jgi:hypothetical protein
MCEPSAAERGRVINRKSVTIRSCSIVRKTLRRYTAYIDERMQRNRLLKFALANASPAERRYGLTFVQRPVVEVERFGLEGTCPSRLHLASTKEARLPTKQPSDGIQRRGDSPAACRQCAAPSARGTAAASAAVDAAAPTPSHSSTGRLAPCSGQMGALEHSVDSVTCSRRGCPAPHESG